MEEAIRGNKTRRKKEYEDGNYINSEYLLTFSLIIIAALILDLSGHVSLKAVNFDEIKNELSGKLHHQSLALTVISQFLNKVETVTDSRVNVLALVGPRGTGKTYTANILRKQFPIVYDLSGPLANKLNESNKILDSCTSQSYVLIIVDNLSFNDVNEFLSFLRDINAIAHDLQVLLISIFSNQETDEKFNHIIHDDYAEKLSRKLQDTDIPHKIATYHEFSTNQVIEWVENLLSNYETSPEVYTEIMDLVQTQDIKYMGVKGLEAKIKLKL